VVFLDRERHRQSVPKVKSAFLPAWSQDGGRLAFIQASGRKKLLISWLAVSR
jgi:Tol biopolymer transport system component